MAAKWMSRQARWIGCDTAKPAVPLMPMSVSITATQISLTRPQSRMVRARNAKDGGVGACAVVDGAAQQQFGGVEVGRRAREPHLDAGDLGDRIAAGAAARFGPIAELFIGALRGAQHRRDEGQGRIGDEGGAIDRMRVERAAGAFALQEVGEPDRPAGRDEGAVANRGVAAGRPHADREPGVGDREGAGTDQKERPFRRAAGLDHAAHHHPSAMIDAAGKRELAGDLVAAVYRDDAGRGDDGSGNGDVEPFAPDRLLRCLGELADVVRVMDHQAAAPGMRGVGLADFAHHLEPGIEPEPVAAEPRRHQNAGDARGQQFIDQFPRHRPRFFRRGGALAEARRQFANPRQHFVMRGAVFAFTCHHAVPGIPLMSLVSQPSIVAFYTG